MDENFDKLVVEQVNNLENLPVSGLEWNKELVWERVSQNLQRPTKTIPLAWFYLAACIALLLTIGSAIIVSHVKQQEISVLESKLAIAQKNSTKPVYVQSVIQKTDTITVVKTITVFKPQTEYIVKTELKTDTVWVVKDIEPVKTELIAERRATVSPASALKVPTNDYAEQIVTEIDHQDQTKRRFWDLFRNPNEGYVPTGDSYSFIAIIE